MRCGFNSLAAKVQTVLGKAPVLWSCVLIPRQAR
ncbi:hypothetical protein [Burkholderia diffusa]